VVSASAAMAGVMRIAAEHRSVIAAPLITLALIPAAAMIGAAIAAGQPGLADDGLERLVLDAALIVVLGGLVLLVMQAVVHRRAAIVSRRSLMVFARVMAPVCLHHSPRAMPRHGPCTREGIPDRPDARADAPRAAALGAPVQRHSHPLGRMGRAGRDEAVCAQAPREDADTGR
jgi:hypothetical protein